MDECWKGSLEIRKEGNHWFEGREELMEEALSLAFRLVGFSQKKGGGEEMVVLGKRKGGNEGIYKMFQLYK